jgi:HEAT repeat protein
MHIQHRKEDNKLFGSNLEKILKFAQSGKGVKALPFASSKKADERAAAATALGFTTDDDSYNTLVNLLRDPDSTVCINAAGALDKLGRKPAAEHLRHTANHTSDEAVKAACNAAAASLSNHGLA